MLRPCRDLEPHPAAVIGQTPAVAQGVDQEQATPALFGRAPADELLMANAGSRVADLAAHAAAAGLDRQLDRASGPMANGIRDELGDDQLGTPAVIGIDATSCGHLAQCLSRCGWSMRCRGELQRY